MSKDNKYFIRPYQAHDEQKIIKLFNQAFLKERTLKHWYWKFRDNPFGSLKISLAVTEDDDIAAHYSACTMPYYLTDLNNECKSFVVFQIVDTMSNPKYRGVGFGKNALIAQAFKHLINNYDEGKNPFGYGFLTGHALKLGLRVKHYKLLEPITLWIKNITSDKRKILSCTEEMNDLKIEEISSLNEEYDDLFCKLADSYQCLILRDKKYLKWRFLDCPDENYSIISIHRKSELIGWLAFKKVEDMLIWGDALFNQEHSEYFPEIFNQIILKYFYDIKRIEAWFSCRPKWWHELLLKTGFNNTNEPNGMTIVYLLKYNCNIINIAELEIQLRKWYYSMADSDLF